MTKPWETVLVKWAMTVYSVGLGKLKYIYLVGVFNLGLIEFYKLFNDDFLFL